MNTEVGLWWLPSSLVGSLGVFAIIGGVASGGPDAVGGVVFGVALVAAVVILVRAAGRGG